MATKKSRVRIRIRPDTGVRNKWAFRIMIRISEYRIQIRKKYTRIHNTGSHTVSENHWFTVLQSVD
jgi:hypothetical protein